MAFRFLTFDMKSFQPTSEIPEISDPQISWAVNEAESITLNVPIKSTQQFINLDSTVYDMPRCGLAVEKDGVLIAAGPLIQRTFNFAQNTCTLTAKGIFDVFHRRISVNDHHFFNQTAFITSVPSYDVGLGWRQEYIAKFFVDDMQSVDHGYLNIDTSGIGTTSNFYREYQTWGFNLKTYHDILTDRADVINGFDFRFFPRWKNSVRNSEIEWAFEIFYPPSGRVTNLVYQLGGNCDFENATVNGNEIAFKAFSVGAGDGNTNLIGVNQDSQYIAADYLLEWVDREHTDVSQLATAVNYAEQARKRRMKEANIPSIVTTISELDNVVIGDQCRVIADYGIYQLDAKFRIMAMTAYGKEQVLKLQVSPLTINGN